MKSVISIGLLVFVSVLNAFAQGPLVPPGAPAPMMKTLDQVEPRTPISSAGYVISQSGSYYLTTNLTATSGQTGITVNADDVTIDLNGFTLTYNDGSGEGEQGIYQKNIFRNLTVLNGSIIDWPEPVIAGTACHIRNVRQTSKSHPNGITVGDDSRISDCLIDSGFGITTGARSTISGCVVNGGIIAGDRSTISCCIAGIVTEGANNCAIRAGAGSTVNNCVARGGSSGAIVVGFGSTIKACSALSGEAVAINAGSGSTISDCTVRQNTFYDGINGGSGCTVISCTVSGKSMVSINVGTGSTVIDCTVNGNYAGYEGINAGSGSTISGCTAVKNSRYGIQVDSGCQVIGNTCDHNGHNSTLEVAGIRVIGSGNRIDGNNVTSNAYYGIDVIGAGNIIVRNTASGNTISNYHFAAGNDIGTIQTTPVGAGAWDNFEF